MVIMKKPSFFFDQGIEGGNVEGMANLMKDQTAAWSSKHGEIVGSLHLDQRRGIGR